MKKNIKIIIVISVIFVALVLLIILWIHTNSVEQKRILSRCPDYHEPKQEISPFPMGDLPILENCSGSLLVYYEDFRNSDLEYRIYDFKHNEYVAYFKNANGYKIVGNFIYVIDESSCGSTDVVFTNGTSTSVKCLNESDHFLYRKADTESGNVTLYKNLSEMSKEDKIIFQSIPR
jgi:hypothetical protein